MDFDTIPDLADGRSAVILTGAGISAESGLDTFRDKDGLWSKFSPQQVATPEGFAKNPALVHNFYNNRRAQLFDANIAPNAAHKALAKLEESWQDSLTIVTTNIDNLHQRAGSGRVIAMHGSLLEAWCRKCDERFAWEGAMDASSKCHKCGAAGGIRVNVVWFGEMPYFMDQIYQLLARAGIFIVIGSSSQVYPAAGFVGMVPHDAYKIEVNPEATEASANFDLCLREKAGTAVPKLVARLLAKPTATKF